MPRVIIDGVEYVPLTAPAAPWTWIEVDKIPPPRDGTAVLFCMAIGADNRPIDPVTMRNVFCQVAQWWGDGPNDASGRWVVYCSMVQDPVLHFKPTHWRPIDTPLLDKLSIEEEQP